MVSQKEFEVLKTLKCNPDKTPDVSSETYQSLTCRGYVENYQLTRAGEIEIEHFRVKNAVILAAGGAEMSPKLIYSFPKGLFKMHGEPIIERQIRQLKDVGITEIYIVAGYKKEMYFYLEDKFDVMILLNPNPRKNNIYSIYAAAEVLDNTYILNCDNYFPNNPFELYVYDTFHATMDREDSSTELIISKNRDGRITSVATGLGFNECMYGHAYFSAEFSKKMREFVTSEITWFRVDSLFWQEFYAKHIEDLDMYAKKYDGCYIFEFDSIQEVQAIDDMFLENISVDIIELICEVLKCKKEDISNVTILETGLSNIIFRFTAFGQEYIVRFPGESMVQVIDRRKETVIQKISAHIGVDNTYLYIDDSGIKISRFFQGAKDLSNLYYKDYQFMAQLVEKIKILHRYKPTIEQQKSLFFNPVAEADRLMTLSSKIRGDLFLRFANIRADIAKLFSYTEKDRVDKVISHNDINAANVLFNGNDMEIIDWEFAGYCDPGFDFGRVLDGYEPDDPEIDRLLEVYFDHKPTFEERRHWIAYIAIHNWYYVNWAIYKEAINENTAHWMTYFYHRVKKILKYVLPLYENHVSFVNEKPDNYK